MYSSNNILNTHIKIIRYNSIAIYQHAPLFPPLRFYSSPRTMSSLYVDVVAVDVNIGGIFEYRIKEINIISWHCCTIKLILLVKLDKLQVIDY